MDIRDIEKSIEWLLYREYEKEFKEIDGINQHKDGLSFFDWCNKIVFKD